MSEKEKILELETKLIEHVHILEHKNKVIKEYEKKFEEIEKILKNI